jgi:hypothetical protein
MDLLTPFFIAFFLAACGLLAAAIAGLLSLVRAFRGRRHRREVIAPITAATINLLRNRAVSVSIPKDIVGTSVPRADAGTIRLPLDWTGADGDRDNLQEMLTDRLRCPVSLSFDMSGRTPSVSLSVPRQPPKIIGWDTAIQHWDSECPYLGQSAVGHVQWDRQEDSPHIGILSGTGGGKSELMAWIVAQIMHGGAGIVVLDPKATSHRWLMNRPGVLYCNERAMLHDTIIWLDDELARRGRANRAASADLVFPQILVLLEERNSLQDMLRDHWYDIKETGDRAKSPALVALDRLNSMGRSLGITVLLAGQESASQHIGSRSNYGSFCVGGNMAPNHWKNVGVARKPAITGGRGRMAYVVAGVATVFQASWVDVKHHPDRLWEWATSGEPITSVTELMAAGGAAAFPVASPNLRDEPTDEMIGSEETATIPSSGVIGSALVTLEEYQRARPALPKTLLANAKKRTPETFPAATNPGKKPLRYLEADLNAFLLRRG